MHWCLYEPNCTHDCDKDCPYKEDMCRCCVSVNYKDCKGCKYNKKGGEKNDNQEAQTYKQVQSKAKHMDI